MLAGNNGASFAHAPHLLFSINPCLSLPVFIAGRQGSLGFLWRQKILARYDAYPSRCLKLPTRPLRDFAASLRRGLVFSHPGGGGRLGNLAGGKLCQSREDEFCFTHVIPEILSFKAFQFLMRLDADAAPFLMNDVGQGGVFILLPDVVGGPVIGEFVSGLLPGHPLLNTETFPAACCGVSLVRLVRRPASPATVGCASRA